MVLEEIKRMAVRRAAAVVILCRLPPLAILELEARGAVHDGVWALRVGRAEEVSLPVSRLPYGVPVEATKKAFVQFEQAVRHM